jgi:hypothetical protein
VEAGLLLEDELAAAPVLDDIGRLGPILGNAHLDDQSTFDAGAGLGFTPPLIVPSLPARMEREGCGRIFPLFRSVRTARQLKMLACSDGVTLSSTPTLSEGRADAVDTSSAIASEHATRTTMPTAATRVSVRIPLPL